MKDVVDYYVSLVASNVLASAAGVYDMWQRANKHYAGSRYAVMPSGGSARACTAVGADVPITLRWTNSGTAPSCDDWEI